MLMSTYYTDLNFKWFQVILHDDSGLPTLGQHHLVFPFIGGQIPYVVKRDSPSDGDSGSQ